MYWGKSQKSTHKRLPAIKSYWISVRDEMANDFGSDFFFELDPALDPHPA